MKILHWAMWAAMTLIFITSGALMRGGYDHIRAQARIEATSAILLSLPLKALSELPI